MNSSCLGWCPSPAGPLAIMLLGLPVVLFLAALLLPPVAASSQPVPTLADAIRDAISPILRNLSKGTNDSAWSFAYKDAGVTVELCEGYRDIPGRVPCAPTDNFAWGSTTKTRTWTMPSFMLPPLLRVLPPAHAPRNTDSTKCAPSNVQ